MHLTGFGIPILPEARFLVWKQTKAVTTGKSYPIELRQRVVAHVEAGHTYHSAAARLLAERGVSVDPSSVWRLFQRQGLTHKKDIQALEQKRAKVARLRYIRITHRQPFMAHMLERIGFLDETQLAPTLRKGDTIILDKPVQPQKRTRRSDAA